MDLHVGKHNGLRLLSVIRKVSDALPELVKIGVYLLLVFFGVQVPYLLFVELLHVLAH